MSTDNPARPAPQAPIQRTGETVTVGCKLPNGLNLGHLHGTTSPIVILNGANHPNAIAGCGLTHGIDRDAITQWLKDHGGEHGIPAIRLGHIFVYDRAGGAVQIAKERGELRTGMEGIDPEAPGDGVEQEDEQKPRTKKAKAAAAEKAAMAELAHKDV